MKPPLLALGALSLLAQVVLLRELSVALYGSELLYVLALGTWLLWTASGATLGRIVAPRPRLLPWLFLGLAVLLPGLVALLRGTRDRKSTRLDSSHQSTSRMPSSA